MLRIAHVRQDQNCCCSVFYAHYKRSRRLQGTRLESRGWTSAKRKKAVAFQSGADFPKQILKWENVGEEKA